MSRQQELALQYHEGEYVWVKDDHKGRLLARVKSSQPLRLMFGQVWLVSVRYPLRWGTSEHRKVIGRPTVVDLQTLRATGLPIDQRALL
jgi:hypothetical protein